MKTALSIANPDIQPLLIRGGLLIDGTGSPGRPADVSVRGGRIAEVGDVSIDDAAARIIDASGLVVAPGFIDTHTHDDRLVLDEPAMACKVTQGVTSVVVGLCGVSIAPRPPRAMQRLPDPLGLLSLPMMSAILPKWQTMSTPSGIGHHRSMLAHSWGMPA
jgi:N-acyl-D-amino-acid deacylase